MDDIRRLEQKLDAICEAVTELRSMWPHMCRRLEHLEHEIYGGNGKIGLANRVQSMYVLAVWLAGIGGTIVGGAVLWTILGKSIP